MPTASILGASGYAGQETLDRLLAHPSRPAADVLAGCLERGLLVGMVGENALRLTPPLTLTDDELEHGLAILEEVV